MADAIGDSLLDASLPFLIGRRTTSFLPFNQISIFNGKSISIFS